MQMKAFADKFGSTLTATLPPLPCEQTEAPPRLLGANASEALAHQRAVRNAMKKDQADLRSSAEKNAKQDDLEAMLAALANLQEQEAEATCVIFPLPDLLRGPKHVAELIMAAHREEGRVLNDEQKYSLPFGWTHFRKLSHVDQTPRNPTLHLTHGSSTWSSTAVVAVGRRCSSTASWCP